MTHRIIYIPQGGNPEVIDCTLTLPAMQALVLGNIEMLYLKGEDAIVFNEEGRLRGFPLNAMVPIPGRGTFDILGPILVVTGDDEGATLGFSGMQLLSMQEQVKSWVNFPRAKFDREDD